MKNRIVFTLDFNREVLIDELNAVEGIALKGFGSNSGLKRIQTELLEEVEESESRKYHEEN